MALLTCHIWHCCLIRVKAPYFYGSRILISLGKLGAGDRKFWKVDKVASSWDYCSNGGKMWLPTVIVWCFPSYSCHKPTAVSCVTYLQLYVPKKHNFQMNMFARCLWLSQKGESVLLLCSPPALRVIICFAFVLTWAGHSVRKRRSHQTWHNCISTPCEHRTNMWLSYFHKFKVPTWGARWYHPRAFLSAHQYLQCVDTQGISPQWKANDVARQHRQTWQNVWYSITAFHWEAASSVSLIEAQI